MKCQSCGLVLMNGTVIRKCLQKIIHVHGTFSLLYQISILRYFNESPISWMKGVTIIS